MTFYDFPQSTTSGVQCYRHMREETVVTTALFDEVREHFPMGRPGGRIVPTAECISDGACTPLGLSLRVAPATVTLVGAATTQATTQTTDGDEGDGNDDANPDSFTDETW
ncbi:hypothetical protein BCF44_110184 [Kutzneria buriramensis]|uniref:Uncharacterized protein n=1 Tax=Kutzneria buriramensis TaxID=1045776 RepID=A0A3E0HCW8_9PSEU|nr:hypothetical protein BCF44_110184 [Kutzneria buriramensis]